MGIRYYLSFAIFFLFVSVSQGQDSTTERTFYSVDEFAMGVDLSYANQVLDHGGVYRDSGSVESPYKIVSDYGANVVRLRLWHNPDWVRDEVYIDQNAMLYSGLTDVTESIQKAKDNGMAVNLDFHYSDIWADPGTQEIPEAWRDITDLEVLKDSVYQYTKNTLQSLKDQDLMPEFVQVGNETNCGMMFAEAPDEFPALNVCDGNWQNAAQIYKSGIQAVREVSANSKIDTKIILHIAQPENVEWFFDNITTTGEVTDFDIIGFSYYSQWSDVSLDEISDYVSDFRQTFNKEVMIMETAYPWTMENADDYSNIFGENSLVDGYPATKEGQLNFMTDLTQEVIDGGGTGVMYWEGAWITSDMKDLWGTGSSWENNTFFDFEGNVHSGIGYMTKQYDSPGEMFSNPVAKGQDPWITKKDGTYYYVESRNGGLYVSKSKSLIDIKTNEKRVWETPKTGWNSSNLWAPELHFVEGKWYIYYTAGKSGPPFIHQRSGVLEAKTDDPMGEYEDKGQLYTGDNIGTKTNNIWSIDLTVLEYQNQLYGIWSGWKENRDTDSTPQHLYIAEMKNPWTISSNRVKISSPVEPWETGTELAINEGAQILKNNRDVFIIYSASESWLPAYNLGQLRLVGENPMNPKIWKKEGPVFQGTNEVYGVGHASFTTSPDGTENWIIYHTKVSPEPGWDRVIHLQEFTWNKDGSPDFGTPVSAGKRITRPSK